MKINHCRVKRVDEQGRITLAKPKLQLEQNIFELENKGAICTLKTKRPSYIHFFLKQPMEKGIVNIKLFERKTMCNCQGENEVNNNMFNGKVSVCWIGKRNGVVDNGLRSGLVSKVGKGGEMDEIIMAILVTKLALNRDLIVTTMTRIATSTTITDMPTTPSKLIRVVICGAIDLQIGQSRFIRSHKSSKVANSSTFASDSVVLKYDNANFDYDLSYFDSDLSVCISKFILDNMVDNYKTLKELTTLDIMYQPWCIRYPELEQAQSYELKFGSIYLLPKFHGLVDENPHKHLKEFHGARNLIFNMTRSTACRVVNELVIGQHHISQLVRVCDICTSVENPTDACPTLQETELNSVEVATMMGDQQYR
ncbi:hypothetical protein CR513_24248, partial [Mucuna pruriens]